ncbi:MAG TPA: PQQ-binding-like beta-propeller repeat protein [Candidatus Latescibacteria bacterium]|nr:PQQ-binding-like beta-propeller repeat protein [Candidatus Latescibacterota bacterium]
MSFSTRGWLLASRSMDLLRQEIELAPRFGINHVQLSHSFCAYAEQIVESSELQRDAAELIERAHRHGIEVFVWTHEMQNVPDHLKLGGKVDLNSRRTWDYVAQKYEDLFSAVPELDGVVLTLTETRIRIDDDNEVVSDRPQPHRIARMVSMLDAICRKHKARLIVRTFTWVPRTMLWYAEAMRDVPDHVTIMTKESWGDWYQAQPPNPLLGLFGRHPQMIEFDCWGEYAGGTDFPWVSYEHTRNRLRYAASLGLTGAIARVDRAERSTFGSLNEFNTIAFSELAKNLDKDLESLWRDWLTSKYPSDAVDAIGRALQRTNQIVQLTFYTKGILNVCTSSPSLVEAEADSMIRFYRDFHGQWKTKLAVLADQLANPTEETLVQILWEKDRALSLCEKSIADIESIRSKLETAKYEILHTGFEKTRVQVRAWRAMTEVVYLHKILERDPTPRLREWFERAGRNLERVAEDIEHVHGKGFSRVRPEPLRNVWRVAESIHSKSTGWSTPLGLYVAASPAIGDLEGNGSLSVVAVSSHKEIVALDGNGRRMWTTTTRGERYEYPHFSSPLIIDGRDGGGARVVVGAADGRLYCLDGQGRHVWEFATGNRVDSAPAAGDLNGDGIEEIVAASLDGTVSCLNLRGERLWNVDLLEPIFAAPVITPAREIIVVTLQGTIACLKADGEIRWRQALVGGEIHRTSFQGVPSGKKYALAEGGPNAIYSSPLLCQLLGAGKPALVLGVVTGKVLAFDLDGTLLWEATTAGRVFSSPAVLPGDGKKACVVIGSDDGRVHGIDCAGRLSWQFQTGGAVRSSPVVVPASIAGEARIVVGSDDNRVYVIDEEGREVDDYLTGAEIFGTPAIADVNGDGSLEIVVGSYDHRVYGFRTPWKAEKYSVISGTFRSTNTRTGCVT